ncbi:hypothetical protein BRETT_000333 [Brettanomyces bruxellensis]|uniref:Smr domain-containing protein n=1 Tax=Dekkera bruxellensis TaxID=5007 RepID=A0A871R2H2_DEKBR|nr:uncharacterized protein BRETT_000333 [Brettanomyces bruxellensis]QOU20623.1 hypothetical protein BRETT_000333 [Brettanomyces bruxellensis]
MSLTDLPEDLSSSIFSLSEIFPDIPLDYIRRVLKSYDYNADKATEELLNYNLLASEGANTSIIVPTKGTDDDMSTTELNKCIKHIEFVEKVLQILKLDTKYTDFVTEVAAADKYKLYFAVFDVMTRFNEKVKLKHSARSVHKIGVTAKQEHREEPMKPVRRRVQGGYTLLNKAASANVTPEVFSDTTHNVDDTDSSDAESDDDNDSDSQPDTLDSKLQELYAIRNSNSILKRMPSAFFTEAMKFFNNEVDQIFYVAACVAPTSPLQEEIKEQSETFGTTLAQQLHLDTDLSAGSKKIRRPHKSGNEGLKPSKESFERMPRNIADYRSLIDQAQKMMNYASNTRHNGVAGFYAKEAAHRYAVARESFATEQVSLSQAKINEAKRTNKLDLHGFVVNSAVACCRKVLADWWNDEIKSRVYHGDSLRSERCVRVEDFVLVTGRGLHSSGGVARIKPAIKKFLASNHYLYDEENSYIIVTGKRLR